MAGGFGRRMKYKTSFTPKPMIILHGKPILEHIINNLKNSGFTNLIITTHYLEHKIIKYFGDGKNFGVSIKYIKEKNLLEQRVHYRKYFRINPLQLWLQTAMSFLILITLNF